MIETISGFYRVIVLLLELFLSLFCCFWIDLVVFELVLGFAVVTFEQRSRIWDHIDRPSLEHCPEPAVLPGVGIRWGPAFFR